jgi:D-3-phosphoglycerate dehydrogenase / 2-oxoglutarate reductase
MVQISKIAIITPISHLPGVKELLRTKGEIFYLEEGNKNQVRNLLLSNPIDTLLCNPNQQTYKIDRDLLKDTNVKLINTCSTGMNHIDIHYCDTHGIKIHSLTKDMDLINDLPSTSELAFGLMISLLRKIPEGQKHVSGYNFNYLDFVGRQIKDLKIGIVGYGRLGKMMEGYCKAFGAETLIYDPYVNVTQTSLKNMFKGCDVISLHVHVTDETKYMINKDLLGLSKKDLYVINTSRGEIVNEIDIVDALKNKKLTGYGADVIENEFDDITKSPIIKAMNQGENIIITPHVGGMTIEGQTKAYTWAINKL